MKLEFDRLRDFGGSSGRWPHDGPRIGQPGGLIAFPCARRVRLLEEAGVISATSPSSIRQRLAFPSASSRPSSSSSSGRKNSAAFRRPWEGARSCGLLFDDGQRDYLLRIVAPNLEAYQKSLKHKLTRLEGVASIESSFALGHTQATIRSPTLHLL